MAYLTTKNNKLVVVTEAEDGTTEFHEVIKGWESFSGWYWFSLEEDHTQTSIISDNEYPDDIIHFGFVQGFEDELGYFSETELKLLCQTLKVWPINNRDLPHSGRKRW
jgi:hypothetical protein